MTRRRRWEGRQWVRRLGRWLTLDEGDAAEYRRWFFAQHQGKGRGVRDV